MALNFDAYKEVIYSAVISDVLDQLGMPNQAMKPFMRPLDDASVFMGRARTGLYAPVFGDRSFENSYENEIKLVDSLTPGDVPVLACGGQTERIAPWGELMSTASKMRGAVGCVTEGLVRDITKIREMGFPVYHGGIGPLDSTGRAKMIEYDTEVVCGGVTVRSGDIVFADVDGVVVVPADRAEEVLELAAKKAVSENNSRDELLQGRLLKEVYDKYGVL